MLKHAPWQVLLLHASPAAVQATPEHECGINGSIKEQGSLVGAPVGSEECCMEQDYRHANMLTTPLAKTSPPLPPFLSSLSLSDSLYYCLSFPLSLDLPLSLPVLSVSLSFSFFASPQSLPLSLLLYLSSSLSSPISSLQDASEHLFWVNHLAVSLVRQTPPSDYVISSLVLIFSGFIFKPYKSLSTMFCS